MVKLKWLLLVNKYFNIINFLFSHITQSKQEQLLTMTKKSLISYVIAVAALYAYSFPVSALPKCPQEGVWHNCFGTYKSDSYAYEGDFVNDKRTGKGTESWTDGAVYEGDFVNGKRTGKGTLTWPDGAVYEGDWVNDKRTGKGTYKSDSYAYEGDFVDDKRTGQGTLTWTDGRVYEGDFVNGQFSGKNKYIANRNDSEQNDTQTISWGKAHPAIKFIATEPGIGRDLKGDWPETLYMFGSLGYKGQPVPPPWGQGQPIIGVIDAQKISKCSYTAIQKIDVGAHYRYGKVQKTFIDFNKINWKTAGNKYSGDEMTVSYDCKGDCISVYGVHSLPKPPRIGWRSATSISFVFENQNGLWGRGSAALKDIADMCSASSSDY